METSSEYFSARLSSRSADGFELPSRRHIESSYTSPLSGRKIPMRCYTTYEHISQAQLALDTKVRILPIYEKLFDIEYPLPKVLSSCPMLRPNLTLTTGRSRAARHARRLGL